MNQPEQYPRRYDDEISLVDLATTFIRRRNVFFVVFALVIIGGLGFIFLSEKAPVTNYVTTLRLAELPSFGEDFTDPPNSPHVINETTERVATLLATVESRWLPQVRAMYRERGQDWPAPVKAESVVGTELVRLATSGVNLNPEDVQSAHDLLAKLIIEQQNDQLGRRVNILEAQVSTLDDVIASRGADSVVAAQAIETRANLQQKIVTGEPAEVLSLATKNAGDESGPSAKLILALAIVLGGMLGIFAAFVAEFISRVRKAIPENNI